MKKIALTLCMLLLSVGAYSQSKLMGAGKATKAGAVASATKKSTSQKAPTTKPKSSTTPRSSGATKKVMGVPFKILDMKLASTDSDQSIIDKAGSKLYSVDLQYFTPVIVYNGLLSSKRDYTLYVKIIDEDGQLIRINDGSPDIYSYSTTFEAEPGTNNTYILAGVGSRDGGFFDPGVYTCEVWYGGKRQISRQVRVYTGSTPVVNNGLMDISDVTFINQDEKGNTLSKTLYDGEVQYVAPVITYRGTCSTSQKAKLYYRFFRADGVLVQGSSSPEGFSTTSDVTVSPGNNTLTLDGYGNTSTTIYTKGTNKFELWLDGEKIYEKKFEVVEKGSVTDTNFDTSNSLSSLRFLLENPLGVTSCNVFTAQRSTFLNAFKSKYTVEHDDSYPTYYYASQLKSSAQLNNLRYCGIPLDRVACFLGDDYTRVCYLWDINASDYPDKFALLNALVADLNKLGIAISYDEINEEHDKARGVKVYAGKEYTVELSDYDSSYWVTLVIDTRI